jgi:hypothetical protein
MHAYVAVLVWFCKHQVRNLKFTLRGGVHDDASKAVLINKLEVTLRYMLHAVLAANVVGDAVVVLWFVQ